MKALIEKSAKIFINKIQTHFVHFKILICLFRTPEKPYLFHYVDLLILSSQIYLLMYNYKLSLIYDGKLL